MIATQRATKLQARMVDDLMDSSSIVAAKLSVELEPVDLSLIVKRAVDAARDAASEKKIATKCIVKPSSIPMRGDSARLEQVVGNLVTNAIKFTPQGGTVTVEVRCPGEEAEISVTDSGGTGNTVDQNRVNLAEEGPFGLASAFADRLVLV